MSLVDEVKTVLEEAERDSALRDQLLRYRKFEEELARAGVVPRRDTYDIPLMSRLRRRRQDTKTKARR